MSVCATMHNAKVLCFCLKEVEIVQIFLADLEVVYASLTVGEIGQESFCLLFRSVLCCEIRRILFLWDRCFRRCFN